MRKAVPEENQPGRLGSSGGPWRQGPGCQVQLLLEEMAAPNWLLTVLQVALALVPSVVMAAMHTTMMRDSLTADSAAVGPSSRFRKLTTCAANLRIAYSFSGCRRK